MSMPRSMNQLDTPVSFYRKTETQGESGAPLASWTELAFPQTYAREVTASATEGEVADQVASFTRVVFWIRHRPGVNNTMRVLRNGQWFKVVSSDVFGRLQWTRVVCERVNDG